MKYTGTKIYNKVLIVENSYGQGYVVEPGNTKMLESAKRWAVRWSTTEEPAMYEYDNGAKAVSYLSGTEVK